MGFNDTKIKVFVDSTKLFDNTISTARSTGLALELTIDHPQKDQILSINVNKRKYRIKFPVEEGYNILLMDKSISRRRLVLQKKQYYYD